MVDAGDSGTGRGGPADCDTAPGRVELSGDSGDYGNVGRGDCDAVVADTGAAGGANPETGGGTAMSQDELSNLWQSQAASSSSSQKEKEGEEMLTMVIERTR